MSVDIKHGYKLTPAGVIPEEWSVACIRDVSEKVGSGITPTGGSRVYKSTGHIFIRSQNVGWGVLSLDDVAFIDENTHLSFQSTEIKENDVLLNITGASIGRSAVADKRIEGGNVNQHVCIIRTCKSKIDPFFLNNYLLSDFGQRTIDSFQAGGNREGLNFEQIKSFTFPWPSLAEQRAIATALSDMDALISGLDQLIAKKSNIKQATMQQLLTGQTRLPGFSGGWEVKRLGDVIDRCVGGGTPSRSASEYWNGSIPWVTVKDFSTFQPHSAQEYITELGLRNCASNLIPAGTLITSTRMALGKAVIYEVDVAINQDIKAIFEKPILDRKFLYYWFEMNRESIDELGSGSTVKGISLFDLKNIEFRLAPKKEQTAIATILSNMDAELASLEARRDKAKQLKQGMMQELLTGRIRLV